MSLLDYTPEQREIKVGANAFFVKALSFSDLTVLIRTHQPDLEGIFDVFVLKNGVPQMKDTETNMAVILALLTQAPGIAANIIALASGDTNAREKAEMLPFPVQVETLKAIGDLTFTEAGGVKKFVEMFTGLLNAVKGNKPSPKTLTKAG
jgi:hypothetical protein